MMFGKPNSISLLVQAEKAEAAADKALAAVSKARAQAARQRLLAARVETEEIATRLEKRAVTAESLVSQARQNYYLAVGERDKAEGLFNAERSRAAEALKCLGAYEKEFDAAVTSAAFARVKVPTTESTE